MSSREQRSEFRVYVLITVLFFVLAVALAGLMRQYWVKSLEPRIFLTAEANAKLLAESQVSVLTEALQSGDEPVQANDVTAILDHILLFTEPVTETPYFSGIRLEVDYGVVHADEGALDLERGDVACPDCFAAEVALYSPTTYELLGIAQVKVSDAFYEQQRGDLRKSLLTVVASGLLVLGGVWVSAILLVYRLHRQTERRKEAELALWENERKYHRLLNSLSNYFVYTRAAEGEFSHISTSITGLLGYSPDEFRSGFQQFLSKHRMNEEAMRHFGAAHRSENEYSFTMEIRSRQGDPHTIEFSDMIVRNEEGEVRAIEGIAKDITEQRKIEEELREAKEQAEAANVAKGQFLANMSHEIRTPMNAIKGIAELIMDTELTAQQKNYLRLLKSSSDSLLSLINDILDFSKVEAGKLELEDLDFGLRDIVGDTLQGLAVRAFRKGVEIASRIAADVPDSLVGDANHFRQILINLVGNAIKFTESGEIVLNIEIASQTEAELLLKCSVRDTGTGIPEEKQESIYRAFEQADASTTRQFGGTGLGLAITTLLVERFGGRIWLDSEVGKGSTFHFTVRFHVREDSPVLQPAEFLPSLRGLRVLLVDSSATSLSIFKELLTNWCLRPTLAATREEAERELAKALGMEECFRLLICSVDLPGDDSYRIVSSLRADSEWADLKIILLTSGLKGGTLGDLDEALVDGLVEKPVKQSAFLEAILHPFSETAALSARGADDEQMSLVDRTLEGRRILLVEDNHINQILACEILEKWGCVVEVVENGWQAVQKLDGSRYDLALMDVQMPVMDGFKATSLIREQEKGREGHMPIIAMTANVMKGDRERCLEVGMDTYIAKPIDRDTLFKAILTVCGEEGEATQATGGESARERHAISQAQGEREKEGKDRGVAAVEEAMAERVSSPAFDEGALLRQVNGSRKLAKELVAIFESDHSPFLEEIRIAIAQGNGEGLSQSAHALKGMVGIFGADEAMGVAQNLEKMGRSGELGKAEAERARLQDEVSRLRCDLDTFMKAE